MVVRVLIYSLIYSIILLSIYYIPDTVSASGGVVKRTKPELCWGLHSGGDKIDNNEVKSKRLSISVGNKCYEGK